MTRRRIPCFLLALLLLIAPVSARADKTDDFVTAELKRQNIPGLSLAIVKDGKIIKTAGYGVANIKFKTAATPETVYKIASVSKQFIATGIMLLVQERRLGLDDPVSNYLEVTPATWKAITIRHLLTHTSGLVREAPGFDPFRFKVMPMSLNPPTLYHCGSRRGPRKNMAISVTLHWPRSCAKYPGGPGLSI
jgi:CubicO group peptidase (beta-lactamase class C family)